MHQWYDFTLQFSYSYLLVVYALYEVDLSFVSAAYSMYDGNMVHMFFQHHPRVVLNVLVIVDHCATCSSFKFGIWAVPSDVWIWIGVWIGWATPPSFEAFSRCSLCYLKI